MVHPQLRRVTEGYGILQPRVSVTMASAAGSLFARTYAGHTGVDPYTTAVSDVYQDLFGEGIFTGKGLYDVDAFMASLEGRVPENALLSHDLFEGVHARAALVTDTEVVDDYPSNVLTHARRQHRWVRGDWQILWWLFPWVPTRSGLERNRLPIISRWKILDNLRRSLVPPSLVALFIAGWTFLPGRPMFWTLVAMATMSFPVWSRAARAARRTAQGPGHPRVRARRSREDLATDLARVSIQLTFVAYQAWDMLDAVGVTWRGWCRAAAASCSGKPPPPSRSAPESSTSRGFYDAMRSSPVDRGHRPAVVAVRAAVPARWPVALPILGLWFAAPLHRLPPQQAGAVVAAGADRHRPRRTCGSWRRARGATSRPSSTDEDRWLPPDNVQFDPEPRIAHRTSPTNIAMTLLSTLSAYDLELIDVDTLVERLDATLTTVDRLEHFEGHLLNWYDTQTLEPLLPKYVSTVDSGNFAAALLTLASGLREHGREDSRPTPPIDSKRWPPAPSAFFDEMHFGFLYDRRRRLFAIGYRLADSMGARAHGQRVLRPARLRGAAGELHRHRQGRRARDALVPSRPADHRACAAHRCCCRGAPRCSST